VQARPAARGALYRSAPVTFVLLSVAVAVFVLGSVNAGLKQELFVRFAQANFLIAEGDWYRIFTPVLLHGSITHILFNMWALYQLGPAVERRVGRMSYLGLYVAAASWGGLAAYRLGSLDDVLVGASGAIFGLFGLWIHSAFRLRDTAFGRNLLSNLGWTLLINAALPFLIPGISWQGHLGGFVAGLLIGELWSRVPGRLRPAVPAAMGALAVLAVLV
jgi:membrane associated rhomboid family serine protease